jgi:UDP-N-acetylglucosamine acyltransferase
MKHTLNWIHPDAKIGKDVEIGHFTTIAGNVIIGDGTWIGSNVVIMDGARIGRNCKIFPGAVVSAIPQDLKFKGEESTVEIGDNTIIREYATLNRGTKATNRTIIGKNCVLMAYVHIAHDCVIGDNCILVNNVGLAGEVKIRNWAILSVAVLVHQFVHIGEHVMIGGAGKVRQDVPPYIKADREPLSYMGINSIGLRRRNFNDEKIKEIQEIYRILYMSNLNNTQAIEQIIKKFPQSEERDNIVSFIKNSERGIIKGYFREK